MKVSYEWLQNYIDLSGYDASQIGEILTRSGVEIDIVEERNQGIRGVVVGYVKKKEKHPDADKLNVCTVDVGETEDLQIVCGAKNVDAGQKVPVALVGSVLPGNFKIKKAKLRGVPSHGMICSAKELGIDSKLLSKEKQDGILVLPEEAEIGSDMIAYLGLSDEILELDLTPNRADCLSMRGVAYEVSANIGREVTLPDVDNVTEDADTVASEHVKVNIEADDCEHYSARYIKDITIQDSPQWLQNRLMAAGVRPINNIVDITNYVMLEYGQPLHAFDADQVDQGEIIVRRAHDDEQITTLDEQERVLDSSMLLITDRKQPLAIAGVMGGSSSEVSSTTKNVILESAIFSGSSVRQTSRKLGLRSESSLRFEKEIDRGIVNKAVNRAAELIRQYAGGVVATGIVEQITKETKESIITISLSKINEYIGSTITIDEVKQILAKLQFTYEEENAEFNITIPTRRGDIQLDVDVIEEIARIYGYDHIPTTLMEGKTTPGALTKQQKIRRAIVQSLSGSGLYEVINYTLVEPSSLKLLHAFDEGLHPIQLAMPMSEERSVLRTSIAPQLIQTATYNRNRNNHDLAMFEMGSVYRTEEQKLTTLPTEKPMLAVLLSGNKQTVNWAQKPMPVDFYDLKGLTEQLFDYLGITRQIQYKTANLKGFHPGRTAEICLDGNVIGYMGQLHPALQKEQDLDATYVMELELQPLYEAAHFHIDYTPLPKYPSMQRDMALLVDEALEGNKLVAAIKQSAGDLLQHVNVFDVYTGSHLPEGKKSIAIALTYLDYEKTLTDEVVSAAHQKVIAHLQKEFNAELR
ncbi:phenylalanine--tRNA ligase subunit beta [Longirhabdus pacifica]|uniref:phenylalanine--tRNA ligase subunit beta n=1 Tax=Longirhabdus pacifica TaxID=2305227 RepID=UPI001008D574|nr:phenylalanine--tRNA ligase subunit beta [Longirhabdus pacifica]